MSCNVQKYAEGLYLRSAEAAQCQVHSTLLLPLFVAPPGGGSSGVGTAPGAGCVGVIEVVQTAEDMPFAALAEQVAGALGAVQLYTAAADAIRAAVPAVATITTLVLPNQVRLGVCACVCA